MPSRGPTFPVRAIAASCSCTHTRAPVVARACSANPVWSVCACVSGTASRSPRSRPSPATTRPGRSQSRGVPAENSTYALHSLQVFTVTESGISRNTSFQDHNVLSYFGLPEQITGTEH